jgi:hypothetical protein
VDIAGDAGQLDLMQFLYHVYHKTKGLPMLGKPLLHKQIIWLRGLDLNQRPSGYEPDELPGCSTPRRNDSGSMEVRQTHFRRDGSRALHPHALNIVFVAGLTAHHSAQNAHDLLDG